MAKSKNKGFKDKKKKIPPEKFLVVVNAWGFGQGSDFNTSTFDRIGAWFECMLRQEYPGVKIQSLYYQRTHRNIIVELPRQVTDITNYLGRHHYSQFLIASRSESFADIYEYKYSVHGDPGEKNWSVGYPEGQHLLDDVPIVDPYPCPTISPPPPIDVQDYAHATRPEVYASRLQKLASELQNNAVAQPSSEPAPTISSPGEPSMSVRMEAPSSGVGIDKGKGKNVNLPSLQTLDTTGPESLYTPYTAPSHLTASLKKAARADTEASSIVQKMDPYEEEDKAARALFSPKKMLGDEADDFLSSLMGTPDARELEEEPEKTEDDYEPSAELLALLGTLPPELVTGDTPLQEDSEIRVKPEPMDESLPDYQPSEELLEAFSSLSQDVFSEESLGRIKPEPQDESLNGYEPSAELLQALSALPQDIFSSDSPENSSMRTEFDDIKPVSIKQEAQSFSIPAPVVKSEPIDDDTVFEFQSRDPRMQQRKTANVLENKRRYSPTEHELTKRVKMEYDS